MSQRVPVDDERLKNHRCGIDNCPSRKYYKVDGRIVCDRGHEQSFLETADDDEGAEAVRRIKHRLGDTVEDQEEKAKRLDATRRLSPEENALLYLQCYQFILNGQLKALMNLGFPEDLESVVKTLWGLYMSTLELKVSDPNKTKTRVKEEVNEDDASYSPSLELEDQSEEAEEESDTAMKSETKRPYRSDVQELRKYPTLTISLLFSYLGLIILRVPVTINQIYSWIKSEEVPYVHGYRLIPPSMLNRLHGHTRRRFTVNTKLEPINLHYWSAELVKLYFRSLNISIPPLNHPPILWKFITAMGIPFEIYPIATAISRAIGISEFSLVHEPKWKTQGGYPESKIMAVIVVGCKLAFDLEYSAAWRAWASVTDDELEKEKQARNDDIGPDEILGMSDEKLDEYMDWLQSTWIDDDQEVVTLNLKRRTPDSILKMFPLHKTRQQNITEPDRSAAPNLLSQITPSLGQQVMNYTIYRSSNPTPPVLKCLIRRASLISGIPEDSLHYSIRWIETKLKYWGQSLAKPHV